MNTIKSFDWKGFKEKYLTKKTAVIIGLIGIALLFLSDMFSVSPAVTADAEAAAMTAEEYTKSLRDELIVLIKNIDGAGECEVMLTLESGVEYIYATEEKNNQNTVTDKDDTREKTETKDDNEQKHILVSDGNGGQKALVVTEKLPKVKGVVVVCEGGDKLYVQSSITDAVSTLLSISVNDVCVIKKS